MKDITLIFNYFRLVFSELSHRLTQNSLDMSPVVYFCHTKTIELQLPCVFGSFRQANLTFSSPAACSLLLHSFTVFDSIREMNYAFGQLSQDSMKSEGFSDIIYFVFKIKTPINLVVFLQHQKPFLNFFLSSTHSTQSL